MIYVLRPLHPALMEVVDAVIEGPVVRDPDDLRREFAKSVLDAEQPIDAEHVGIEPFLKWLEGCGYRVLNWDTVDTIIDAAAVKNWNAKIVDGPDVKDVPPTSESVIPRDGAGKPLIVP